MPGWYYVGVTDAKGCTKEGYPMIDGPAQMIINDDPNDCKADLSVENGSGYYTYSWSITPTPQTQPTGPKLNLCGLSNVEVTVTDSITMCTATLKLKQKNCHWFWCMTWQSLLLLIGGGILVIGTGIFLLGNKKK